MSPQTNYQNHNNDVNAVEPSLVTKLFASALFSGYSPIASGTVGSVVALAFYFIPGFESLVIFVNNDSYSILSSVIKAANYRWNNGMVMILPR